MDQDETWPAGRPRPWPHCVRWGPSSPSPKEAQPPIYGPYLLQPNGCMDQDVTWYGARPQEYGRKIGASVPFLEGRAGSPSSTMRPRPRPTFVSDIAIFVLKRDAKLQLTNQGPRACQVPSSSIQSFGHNRHGSRPTLVLSGILIHPAIWPQQIWAKNWGGCAPFGRGSWVPI